MADESNAELGGRETVGSRVGHIRIVGRLGEGGWGTVYEGIDETLGRRVALKALRGERLDGQARARLRREARILSRLEDSRICRIHDYVAGPQGDFLVLERVDGQTLREALREAPARLTPRLQLHVAEQLAAVLVRTHAEGIVHRDLKPSNVMLTLGGDVKVLDFGIALADEAASGEEPPELSGDGRDRAAGDAAVTLLETRRGRILGTAQYMSPEQARGERATPASDMYSLGLLLQELFTGQRPQPAGLTVEELLARASGAETVPVGGLRGDLTRLINRLKSHAAAHRPTAAETHLALRRIIDRPRRRLRLAAAVVLALLATAAGVAHAVRLAAERNAAVEARLRAEAARREAEGARSEAERSRLEAGEVRDFLLGLFAVADPSEARGRTVTAEELLHRGAERIERELASQPLVRARMMMTIGTVYRELGLYAEAEQMVARALSVRRQELGPRHLEVADSLRGLGILHDIAARYDRAESVLREALAIQRGAPRRDQLGEAATLIDLGEVLRHRGQGVAAGEVFRRAAAIQERYPEARDDLARTLNNLAGVYWREERIADAEPLLARVLAIEEKMLGGDHPRLARTLNNLGLLVLARGRQTEAEALFHRALAIKQQALGGEHPELASTVYNLGDARFGQGDIAGALVHYQRALALDEKGNGPRHPNVAFSLTGVGHAYRDLGRFAEAERAYARALAILDAAAPGHPARQDVVAGQAELARRRSAAAAAGAGGRPTGPP